MHTFLSGTVLISKAMPAKESKARQRSSLVRSVISLGLPGGAGDSTRLKSSELTEGPQHGNDTFIITNFQPERKQPVKELSVPSPRLFSSLLH